MPAFCGWLSAAIVLVSGELLNPLLVRIAADLGEGGGELTGYLAGVSGRAVIQDRERYQWLVELTRRYGLFVVSCLSVISNPLFDLAGIAAGVLHFSPVRYLLACCPGKTIKTTVIALLGAGSFSLLAR